MKGSVRRFAFGANGPEVITRLKWMATKLQRVMKGALDVTWRY